MVTSLPSLSHPVGQVTHLLITPVGTDQVGVVDPAVIQVLSGLHLCLDLLDNVTLLNDVVRDLDPGNRSKGRSQNLGLILVGGQGFRNNLDVHPLERLRSIDEPLHFLFLVGARERRHVADLFIQKSLCLVHA